MSTPTAKLSETRSIANYLASGAGPLEAEFLSGVEEHLVEIAAERPGGEEEEGDGSLLVVSHQLCSDPREQSPCRGAIGEHLLGEVESTDLRKEPPGLVTGEAEHDTHMGEIDDLGGIRSWAYHRPLSGADGPDEPLIELGGGSGRDPGRTGEHPPLGDDADIRQDEPIRAGLGDIFHRDR